MKAPKKTKILALGLAALTCVASADLFAQSVATDPVGYVKFDALANSDTLLAAPLAREVAFAGKVASVAGNSINLSGASLAVDQFLYVAGVQPNTYYVQMTSGAADGQISTVLDNDAGSIQTEFESDILNSIQANDSFVVRPYWTLGVLFPSSDAGVSFFASSSNFQSGRQTEVIFPNVAGTGINRSPNRTYFFNSFWRRVGATGDNANDVIVSPDTYLIIRGNNNAASTSLTVLGSVVGGEIKIPLLSLAGQRNDNIIGIPLPKDMRLDELNLVGDGLPFVQSTSNFQSGRGDELLVFNNATVGKNKAPSSTYFYNGFWRKVGATGDTQNATTLPAGSAIIIRKASAATSATVDWSLSLNLQ